MKPNVIDAIIKINPAAQVSTRGNDINTIVWENGTTEIPTADIQTKLDELQAEYDALAYARKREAEYPSTKDFMEAYTEKEIGGDTTKWDAYVINYNKVRTENPK
jgi:hypothetical protein